MNCVKKAHGRKMSSTHNVQKSTKHHRTLLHSDTDCLQQRKPEEDDKVEETHVVALTVSEQVLLMTCKVKVTTVDGSSTKARALLIPRSSASYVHERLAQHLC